MMLMVLLVMVMIGGVYGYDCGDVLMLMVVV